MNQAKKMTRCGLGLAFVALLGFAVIAQAGSESKVMKSKGSEAKSSEHKAFSGSVKVTVTGENVCVGCLLKKEKGAASQCSAYGHRHGLRIATVGKTYEGHEVKKSEHAGAILHYLENDKSKELVTSHHGAKVEVTGTLYKPEYVLEVDSYKVVKAAGSESKDTKKKPSSTTRRSAGSESKY